MSKTRLRVVITAVALATLAVLSARRTRAAGLDIPQGAQKALDAIYSGDAQQGAGLARSFEQSQPENPLGYLIEDEALWWERYCEACEVKWGIVETWEHDKRLSDEAYFALADKAIALAQAQLAKYDSADMHFYAGMADALKVRMYGLRGENRAAARAGVAARSEMIEALKLDPHMADATAAMGIYNYYVDTLSPMLKFLRFLIGIPGGDKQEGIRQMEIGMADGKLLAVDVRFILAGALRRYDRQYQEAISVAQPLVAQYPRNPVFLLLVGNLNMELGRNVDAQQYFRAVEQISPDSPCVAHSRELVRSYSPR
ncbi:MAG TPA: hypothetical protein VMF66_12060 [Candidatus Acidoferrum sp.]|nr:hypothetical protein [Candidatus Acidoferrum sp.]